MLCLLLNLSLHFLIKILLRQQACPLERRKHHLHLFNNIILLHLLVDLLYQRPQLILKLHIRVSRLILLQNLAPIRINDLRIVWILRVLSVGGGHGRFMHNGRGLPLSSDECQAVAFRLHYVYDVH